MTILAPDSQDSLRAAYTDADHRQRVRLSKVGCILGFILVPLFWGLDWVIYPDHAFMFGLSRLLCVIGIAAVYGLLFTGHGRRWIRMLSIAWALLPGLAISWMIWINGGEASSYYAGLNLVMIIVSLLMPWTSIEVALVCILTIGMYLAACVLHAPEQELNWRVLLNNLYFMIATAIICITAGYFSNRRRFEDFRLRYELSQKNIQMAELDRLKGEFYANVSHELRTPLTLILAPLGQLFDHPGMDRQGRATLQLIHSNALRLLRLINDLLDIVRMDEGKMELKRRTIDLGKWVPGIVQSVQHLAAAKKLALTCASTSSTSTIVDIDPLMMEKVLLNLLSNAIKFTPEQGRVTVSWGTASGQTSWLEVTDTGIGIAAEDLPHLFGRFHQVDSSATRRYRGLGLGLALSRDLVVRHGGRMTVSSIPKKGSTFRIELPPPPMGIGDAPTPSVGAPDLLINMYQEADREGHVFNPLTDAQNLGHILEPYRNCSSPDLILVADDEPDMRHFIVDILRQRHRVVAAADGDQAVELARKLQPDLAILDMMMPQLDGMQTCRALRADEALCDCRIILLTARADDETKLNALQGGADDFLIKPFNSQEVLSRVRNLLENTHLQRRLLARNRELEDVLARLGRAEAQLVQNAKMNALGSLTAGLLHEINNPLNFTQMAVRCARDRIPASDADVQDMLKDISDGMSRIGDIITGLRTFAYPESVSLDQVFPATQAIALARRFTTRQCEDIVIEDHAAPLNLHGSVNHISMVLVNLLDNAAKAIRATKDGRTGRITITTEQHEDRCHLSIRDNGVGMDQQHIQRAFDPFFTTSQIGQGLGLGLSICHTIITNHQGEISIDSAPGIGTTITIVLPLTPPQRQRTRP